MTKLSQMFGSHSCRCFHIPACLPVPSACHVLPDSSAEQPQLATQMLYVDSGHLIGLKGHSSPTSVHRQLQYSWQADVLTGFWHSSTARRSPVMSTESMSVIKASSLSSGVASAPVAMMKPRTEVMRILSENYGLSGC